MIPEFGHYALILAIGLASIQATIPLIGAMRGKLAWMNLAKSLAYGQFIFIGISFLILAYTFVSNDFSVAYVASNSNSHLPLIYRFCAVWGAHEGSLLLWVFILSIWMVAVSLFSRSLPIETLARVLAILAMISWGFLLFLLTTSNPFLRLLPEFPHDGRDLNPLLQDPGLVGHPPMLYMGYVGFSVAFAFAIAALLSGRLDATWARWSRPWTLTAWCFLTLGITLGSWWAYRELGWGGWWFWDPVENASFLPWLVGTALIHSLMVTEKRHTFKAWTVLLAIGAFSLSLLGTFLVRSGILMSVHAFAVDSARGSFMLKFLALVVGASLLLYACRAQKVRTVGEFALVSRESFLLSNNVFLVVAMTTVLLGTLYPLVIEIFGWGKISVGAPYFNKVFAPIIAPALFLMAVAPMVHWQSMDIAKLVKRLRFTFILAITMAVFLLWFFTRELSVAVVLGVILALWIICATFQNMWIFSAGKLPRIKILSRAQWGMIAAHLGVAICVLGVVLTSAYSVERNVRMNPGDFVSIGPYQFQLLGLKNVNGANYEGIEAEVAVFKNGSQIQLLRPQQRLFTVQQVGLAKPAIDAGLFRDLYVALGEPIGKDSWALRIYYKPFVRWIWLGGLLMLFGGILAATDKRYRMKFH